MHLPSEIPSGRSEVHRIRDRKSDAAQLHAAATELREKHLIEEKLTKLRRKKRKKDRKEKVGEKIGGRSSFRNVEHFGNWDVLRI